VGRLDRHVDRIRWIRPEDPGRSFQKRRSAYCQPRGIFSRSSERVIQYAQPRKPRSNLRARAYPLACLCGCRAGAVTRVCARVGVRKSYILWGRGNGRGRWLPLVLQPVLAIGSVGAFSGVLRRNSGALKSNDTSSSLIDGRARGRQWLHSLHANMTLPGLLSRNLSNFARLAIGSRSARDFHSTLVQHRKSPAAYG
jgi:hypothetical protein